MQIVLDQLRPEFIDAFDMKNVKRLMRGGASYPNAYLGHMASETVVSPQRDDQRAAAQAHGLVRRVVPRRRRPARRPPATGTSPGRCRPTQFDTLINAAGYPKLADYLHAKFPGKIVAAIGEKNYAVHTMGGPSADMRITFGSRIADCDGDPTSRPT